MPLFSWVATVCTCVHRLQTGSFFSAPPPLWISWVGILSRNGPFLVAGMQTRPIVLQSWHDGGQCDGRGRREGWRGRLLFEKRQQEQFLPNVQKRKEVREEL